MVTLLVFEVQVSLVFVVEVSRVYRSEIVELVLACEEEELIVLALLVVGLAMLRVLEPDQQRLRPSGHQLGELERVFRAQV